MLRIRNVIGSAIALLFIAGCNIDVAPETIATPVSEPLASQEEMQSRLSYRWATVAIGGGGFITGYDADPTGVTRVIRTDVFGAYVWTAEKDRWVQLVTTASMPADELMPNTKNEGVFEVAVAPSMPKRVFMVTDGSLYRSDDGGKSFVRPQGAGGPFPAVFDANSEFRHYGPFVSVAATNADIVLAGLPNAGLWRSADAGASWSKVNSVPDGSDIRAAEGVQSPGVLIWQEKTASGSFTGGIWAMSSGHGMYRSDDRGVTFRALTSGGPAPKSLKQGVFASDGAFYGVDPESKTVWRFSEARWHDVTAALGAPARRFAAVTALPGQVLVFDEGGRAFRSRDSGASWTRLSHRSRPGEGEPPWLRVSSMSYFATGQVLADPVTPGRIWNSAGTGVYFADVGQETREITWISQTRGVEELVSNDVIQPPGQLPLFAAWDFGIHVKDDLEAFSTTYGPKERVLIAAQQMDWSPSNPAFIVTNASDTRMTCCSEDGQSVLAGYSEDGGRSWSRFATLPTPPGTKASDPWRMSFGSIAVSADDTDNIVWAPAFNRSPFFTTDRGRTWTRVQLAGERLPETGSYARYFYKRKTLAADRVAPGTFYLVHSGDNGTPALAGVWRTQDKGATWQKVFAGEVAPMSQVSAKLRAVPEHAGHLFFTSGNSTASDASLKRSNDGGAAWASVPDVTGVLDVAFGKAAVNAPYPAIFIAGRVKGEYGVWRSLDDTHTWSRVGVFPLGSLDEIATIEGDKDHFGRVYVGFRGSGWAYGEPSSCTPAEFRFGDDSQCYGME